MTDYQRIAEDAGLQPELAAEVAQTLAAAGVSESHARLFCRDVVVRQEPNDWFRDVLRSGHGRQRATLDLFGDRSSNAPTQPRSSSDWGSGARRPHTDNKPNYKEMFAEDLREGLAHKRGRSGRGGWQRWTEGDDAA